MGHISYDYDLKWVIFSDNMISKDTWHYDHKWGHDLNCVHKWLIINTRMITNESMIFKNTVI